eukprot:2092328-Amphidinium_carterae.1
MRQNWTMPASNVDAPFAPHDLYLKSTSMVSFLLEWSSDAPTLVERIEQLWAELYMRGKSLQLVCVCVSSTMTQKCAKSIRVEPKPKE